MRYNLKTAEKPKTITIDAKYKEAYYYASNLEAVPEAADTLEHRHVLWNYMMNVSMQNTIAQMAKRR